MDEIGLPKSYNGLIYMINSVEKNTEYKCPKSCYWAGRDDFCTYKKEISQRGMYVNKHGLKGTIVKVNVKNIGYIGDWVVGAEDIHLVDSDGFVYEGKILCEDAVPYRYVKGRTKIPLKTQINYIQLFPCIPDGIDISKLIVNIGGQQTDFILQEKDYNDWKEEADVFTVNSNNYQNSDNNGFCNKTSNHIQDINRPSLPDFVIENLNYQMRQLKLAIYSRLNNELTSSECTKLENKISNMCYELKLDLEGKSKNSNHLDSYKKELNDIMENYENTLKSRKEKPSEKELIAKKIDELLELNPRDFELYIGELFKHLGYESKVTPYINDKGIDIIMYKDDVKYGVQCKRYKGSVGSPDIQTFIGALANAKADKGVFVTTGMFTFEAEKMAANHPIQLINRIDLAKLILEAINH